MNKLFHKKRTQADWAAAWLPVFWLALWAWILAGCGVSANPNAVVPTMLLAQVIPAEAAGSVSFLADGKALGTVTVANGQAMMTVNLRRGKRKLEADFMGSGNYRNSTDTITYDAEPPATLVIFRGGSPINNEIAMAEER
jgi:uncharacterized protein GlcG (DUF336 family)